MSLFTPTTVDDAVSALSKTLKNLMNIAKKHEQSIEHITADLALMEEQRKNHIAQKGRAEKIYNNISKLLGE